MTKSYDIKRGDTLIATVKPQGSISEAIMGESGVTMSFELPSYVAFHIGDTVRVDTVEYVLNTEPSETKISKKRFQYQLSFQGFKFELDNTAYLFLGDDNTLKEVEFSLMANAAGFVDLIVANMNREHSGWTRGLVDDTEFVNMNFSEQSCLSVIADLAVQFKTEYWIVGKTIHLTKRGNISGLNLEYGRGKGLYQLGRSQPSDKKLFTRIIPRGGTQNIPGSYRGSSTRLQLPVGVNYLERNVNKYGVRECPRTYDEIYPRRICTVSSVGDEFTFSDSSLDFDVNAQQVPGSDSKGKITFNTGQLSGYEFDIVSYDHVTKTFKIGIHKDEKAITVPSALIRPAVGDKFVVTEIIMPDADILNAELELQAKAQADLNQNSDPWATYSLIPDALHFKRENIVLVLGDYVHIADDDLDIDEDIRVISYKKDLQDYYKYTEIGLATVVAIADIVKEFARLEQVDKAVRLNRLTEAARARRNYKTTEELKNLVFDPDGYFTDKIRPLSIETTMLSVGAKSQQFVLNGILFTPNFEASQAKIRTTAGTLDHFSITETIRSWNIAAYSNDGLVSGTAYYIYAKCDKGGSEGTLLLSTSQITVAQDATFYHFLIGVLHTAIDGVRGISLTYGQTTINGRFVKTGTIASNNGATVFNLDTGEISGKITFGAGSGGYNNLSDKPDLSGFATNAGLTALQSSLGSLAYLNLVEAAKLGTTVIEGGYIKSTLLNVSAIVVAGGLETTSGAQSKANAAQSAATSAAASDATSKANAAQAAAIAAAAASLSSLSGSLGALAYESLVGVAKMDSTVIVGGYIKSSLLDVSAIIVNGSISTTSDAQSRANAAQSNAIAAAASDATTKANAAQSAAQTYAAAQAAYEREVAKAHADGIVDTEEARAIADAAAKLVEAKADATTKANAAQSAAQSYAASAVSALSAGLGSLAYQNLVAASMLDSTIIVGGYIKTSLLDVDFIKGLAFDFVSGTVGGFTITSDSITSDKHDGKLVISSGDDPYIHMTRYFYPSPEVPRLSLFGSRMTPYGVETMSLLVRSGGIIVDTDKPGVTGTFLSGDGVSTISVQDGVIIGL